MQTLDALINVPGPDNVFFREIGPRPALNEAEQHLFRLLDTMRAAKRNEHRVVFPPASPHPTA